MKELELIKLAPASVARNNRASASPVPKSSSEQEPKDSFDTVLEQVDSQATEQKPAQEEVATDSNRSESKLAAGEKKSQAGEEGSSRSASLSPTEPEQVEEAAVSTAVSVAAQGQAEALLQALSGELSLQNNPNSFNAQLFDMQQNTAVLVESNVPVNPMPSYIATPTPILEADANVFVPSAPVVNPTPVVVNAAPVETNPLSAMENPILNALPVQESPAPKVLPTAVEKVNPQNSLEADLAALQTENSSEEISFFPELEEAGRNPSLNVEEQSVKPVIAEVKPAVKAPEKTQLIFDERTSINENKGSLTQKDAKPLLYEQADQSALKMQIDRGGIEFQKEDSSIGNKKDSFSGLIQAQLETQKPQEAEKVKAPQAPLSARVLPGSLEDQVLRQIKVKLSPGLSKVDIRLYPPELGSVRIRFDLEGDRMKARVEARENTTAVLLERHLPELKQAMSQAGIEVKEFEIVSGQQLGDFNFAEPNQSQEGKNSGPKHGQGFAEEEGTELEEITPAARELREMYRARAQGGINYVV